MQRMEAKRLKGEMEGLEYQRKSAFKAPPKEWIDFRLEKLHKTLDKNTKASALALKDLLGSIELEPVPGECTVENGRLIENRAYYIAQTNIDTLALLEETKGSNWLRCRTRQQPIRTISFIHCQIKIPLNPTTDVKEFFQTI